MNIRTKWGRSAIVTLALTCGVMYTTQPIQVDAKTSAQMIQKKEEIDKKIKELNKEINKLQKKLDKKQQEYDKTVKDIEDTNKDIKETEKKIQERSVIINNRLKAYQGQDSTMNTYLDAFLGGDNISEGIGRVIAVKTVLDADQELRDEDKADKEKLAKEKQSLQEKQAKLQKQFQDMQDEENHLETKKAENKAKSLKLKEQIATKKQQEKLEKERKKREEEARRLKALQEKQFIEAKKAQEASKAANSIHTESVSDADNTGDSGNTSNAGNAGNGTNGAKVTDGDQKAPSVSGSGSAKSAIAEASKYLGRAYVWGGSNPTSGFDCSGLTQWSFKQAGVSLPRTAAQQYLATTKVSASEAKAGDLVFFSYGSGVAHVGIYLGGGRMLDAQNNGVVVESLDWWNKYLVGYGRISGVN